MWFLKTVFLFYFFYIFHKLAALPIRHHVHCTKLTNHVLIHIFGNTIRSLPNLSKPRYLRVVSLMQCQTSSHENKREKQAIDCLGRAAPRYGHRRELSY